MRTSGCCSSERGRNGPGGGSHNATWKMSQRNDWSAATSGRKRSSAIRRALSADRLRGIDEGHAQRLPDLAIGDLSRAHVEARAQVRIALQRLAPALVRQRKHE